MFASTSFAGWTKVAKVDGNTFYVDLKDIRKHGGYTYFWYLKDYLKPNKDGVFSSKFFLQSDCNLRGFKFLSDTHYVEPMGRGTPRSVYNVPDKNWDYSSTDTLFGHMIKLVCSR